MTVPVVDREGFRRVISSTLAGFGLSDAATRWDIDPNAAIGDQDRAVVGLDVFSMSALAVDEHRRFLSDGTDGYAAGTFWVLEIGNREVVITVKAEAFDRGVEAAEIIDYIRTGIRADAATAALNAIGMAYVWSTKAIRVPARVDSRALNTAVADFEFGAIGQQVSLVVPPGVGGDYIATVDGPSNIVLGTLTP